jgi:hypothetical protein
MFLLCLVNNHFAYSPYVIVQIFKKTEKYHKLSNPMKHWKELCSWLVFYEGFFYSRAFIMCVTGFLLTCRSEPINIMAMSLSANGRSLAVLRYVLLS